MGQEGGRSGCQRQAEMNERQSQTEEMDSGRRHRDRDRDRHPQRRSEQERLQERKRARGRCRRASDPPSTCLTRPLRSLELLTGNVHRGLEAPSPPQRPLGVCEGCLGARGRLGRLQPSCTPSSPQLPLFPGASQREANLAAVRSPSSCHPSSSHWENGVHPSGPCQSL